MHKTVSDVKPRNTGKILQKKVIDVVVTFGYGHSRECRLLQVQKELKEKNTVKFPSQQKTSNLPL